MEKIKSKDQNRNQVNVKTKSAFRPKIYRSEKVLAFPNFGNKCFPNLQSGQQRHP